MKKVSFSSFSAAQAWARRWRRRPAGRDCGRVPAEHGRAPACPSRRKGARLRHRCRWPSPAGTAIPRLPRPPPRPRPHRGGCRNDRKNRKRQKVASRALLPAREGAAPPPEPRWSAGEAGQRRALAMCELQAGRGGLRWLRELPEGCGRPSWAWRRGRRRMAPRFWPLRYSPSSQAPASALCGWLDVILFSLSLSLSTLLLSLVIYLSTLISYLHQPCVAG